MVEEGDVQVGVFLLGAVPMPDAGPGDPQPKERRASNDLVWQTTERLVDMVLAAFPKLEDDLAVGA